MHYRVNVVVLILIFCFTSLFSQERGKATYYSKHINGRKMSNGKKYHSDSMTCAHKYYPLGTMLKVKNPQNGAEVIVKVTDRGPFGKKMMIDLSYGAAKQLGILSRGIAIVEVEVFRDTIVPFRLEDEDIPKLELENNDNDYKIVPSW
ncbi:MAG: septal ring lytic transglycosylase RlpA family protein [Bacteroidaceae bacterium]|nr:septal ring lytic transglycosylase RlpA family protein [Bacteroidaceae bacterium]